MRGIAARRETATQSGRTRRSPGSTSLRTETGPRRRVHESPGRARTVVLVCLKKRSSTIRLFRRLFAFPRRARHASAENRSNTARCRDSDRPPVVRGPPSGVCALRTPRGDSSQLTPAHARAGAPRGVPAQAVSSDLRIAALALRSPPAAAARAPALSHMAKAALCAVVDIDAPRTRGHGAVGERTCSRPASQVHSSGNASIAIRMRPPRTPPQSACTPARPPHDYIAHTKPCPRPRPRPCPLRSPSAWRDGSRDGAGHKLRDAHIR